MSYRAVAVAIFFSMVIPASCGSLPDNREATRTSDHSLQNRFTVPPQVPAHPEIQSLQLYRQGSPTNPPIIRLDRPEQLVLAFDVLRESSGQFVLRIEHYSSEWTPSPIPPDYYLEGFFETYFGNGIRSLSERPSYWHYEFTFPNRDLEITASGNYLLTVYDANNREPMFSLPFYVSEDAGTLTGRVEQLFARRNDLRQQDQLFSRYRYPEFVELPQFELSFYYVPDRLWGRSENVTIFDTSTPGTVHFHLSREQAFVADYRYSLVDLNRITVDGTRIIEVREETTPPTVILRRDTPALESGATGIPASRNGIPESDRAARYATVQFRLETDATLSRRDTLYLVGDFNQWSIRNDNRMTFDPDTGFYTGQAVVKEGSYAYKYVTVQNRVIDDLKLDRTFTATRREYTTMVYYQDPSRRFDRLLKVEAIQ